MAKQIETISIMALTSFHLPRRIRKIVHGRKPKPKPVAILNVNGMLIIVKKVGLDPAVVASPIITTIIDALGLIIYFKIAQVMLLNLL